MVLFLYEHKYIRIWGGGGEGGEVRGLNLHWCTFKQHK